MANEQREVRVGVLMGSDTDLPVMSEAGKVNSGKDAPDNDQRIAEIFRAEEDPGKDDKIGGDKNRDNVVQQCMSI